MPHSTRSGAALTSACAKGMASTKGGPAADTRSAPHTLTQQLPSFISSRSARNGPCSRPAPALDAAHVINHEGQGECAKEARQFNDIGRVQMDDEMPSERLNALKDMIEDIHVRHSAQMMTK